MSQPLRVLVGSLGPGMLPDAAVATPPEGTILLDLGPDHPSRAGLLELRLWIDGHRVAAAEVGVGFLHRGAEKLFEVRDYRQILMLADRHDWHAPFAGELAIALTCEQLLGLEVPPRATWLRTLLAEHTRILSHLGFLAYLEHASLAERRRVAQDAPTGGGPWPTFVAREALRNQTFALTGNRIHPMANRIGGLAMDADDRWLDAELACMNTVQQVTARLEELLTDPHWVTRSRGVGPLTAEVISHYGVSGPAARASGVRLDLRLQQPYLAYGDFAPLLTVPSPPAAGDAWTRLALMVHETQVSVTLVRAAVEQLRTAPGPVSVRLPKIVRLPEGETYLATEAPLGTAGVYLVSRGEKVPWRLRLRTPSFSNVAALESMLIGVAVAELETTLASMSYVVGDIDR